MAKTRKPLRWTDDDLQRLINERPPETPTLDPNGPQWESSDDGGYVGGMIAGLAWAILIDIVVVYFVLVWLWR